MKATYNFIRLKQRLKQTIIGKIFRRNIDGALFLEEEVT